MKENQFAIWRVDAPWSVISLWAFFLRTTNMFPNINVFRLPKTKKAKGVKLGGGKGSLSHYVTPVREGRIIFELGGYIIEHEVKCYYAA